MASLIATWKFETQDAHWDEYMKHIGVGLATRTVAAKLKPSFTVAEDGGTWKLLTASTFKNTEVAFQPGVEFDETTADGRDVKSTIVFEGEKMIHSQKDPKTPANDTVIEREVVDGKLHTTVKCGAIVSLRTYIK